MQLQLYRSDALFVLTYEFSLEKVTLFNYDLENRDRKGLF